MGHCHAYIYQENNIVIYNSLYCVRVGRGIDREICRFMCLLPSVTNIQMPDSWPYHGFSWYTFLIHFSHTLSLSLLPTLLPEDSKYSVKIAIKILYASHFCDLSWNMMSTHETC